MRKVLTYDNYKKFLDVANYDYLDHEVVANNQKMMRLSIKELTDEQLKRFGKDGRKIGCCFNFSNYLLAKYKGMLLTCKDMPGVHCAFVYLGEDDNLYICDPAKAKTAKNGNDYFNIPINEYAYMEDKFKELNSSQIYRIYYNMFPNDEVNSFLDNYKDAEKTLNLKSMKEIDHDDELMIKHILNENLSTGVD